MKRVLSLIFGSALSLQAQHTLDWHTIGCGGSTSTGSVYSISGTIGQQESGRISGANYTIAGGFWSIVAAIQTAGAPTLRIELNGAQVILAWPSPSTGFRLEQSPSLEAPAWTNVGEAPVVVGPEKHVALPSWPGTLFFRLHRP